MAGRQVARVGWVTWERGEGGQGGRERGGPGGAAGGKIGSGACGAGGWGEGSVWREEASDLFDILKYCINIQYFRIKTHYLMLN